MAITKILHHHRFVAVVVVLLLSACAGAEEEPTTKSTSTAAPTTAHTATALPLDTSTTVTTTIPTTTNQPTTTSTSTTTTSPRPTTTTTTTPPTSTTTLPPPPPFVGSTKPVSNSGTGFGQLEDTRMAQHVNYDRFVLEFEEHVPGYDIAYATPPFIDIPGNMVGVAGNVFLRVRLHGASIVDWDESTDGEIVLSYEGPRRVTAATNNYTEAVFVTDFEAEMEWILGLADRVPFRVYELNDPARLVIDVGHDDVTKAEVPMQSIDGEGTGFGWMKDSRLARHDTFDRFVIQFGGQYQPGDDYPEPGKPDLAVHYVGGPFGGCDSTDLIPVDGDAYIMIELRPAAGTDWNRDPPRVIYSGNSRLRADTDNITESVLIGECEGIQWVIGVEEATEFSATWLTSPLRLVIDVLHMTSD